jgi:hypothetical protein
MSFDLDQFRITPEVAAKAKKVGACLPKEATASRQEEELVATSRKYSPSHYQLPRKWLEAIPFGEGEAVFRVAIFIVDQYQRSKQRPVLVPPGACQNLGGMSRGARRKALIRLEKLGLISREGEGKAAAYVPETNLT